MQRIELVQSEALAAGGSPVERLERWLDALVSILGGQPTFARLLLRTLFEDEELTGQLAEEREARAVLRRILGATAALLREGMERGQLLQASVPHMLQSLIGLTVYHFASGRFGSELLGRSLFHPAEVRRRRETVRELLRHGLVRSSVRSDQGQDSGKGATYDQKDPR